MNPLINLNHCSELEKYNLRQKLPQFAIKPEREQKIIKNYTYYSIKSDILNKTE